MGRIPTFIIIIIGVVLVVGLSALMLFVVLKPQQEELKIAEQKYNDEQDVADRLPAVEAELARVTAEWLTKQAQLKDLMKRRSIPISFHHPAAAMIALWFEYRHDLVPLIERWVESTGCTIESGASFPAPAMTPPPVPANGFMQEPAGQTITLTVSGTLASLERLYRSLELFPRVVTVGQLIISGDGDNLRAQVPFKFYLLAEVPAAAAAPPPSAAPPEGMAPPEGEAPQGEDTAAPDATAQPSPSDSGDAASEEE